MKVQTLQEAIDKVERSMCSRQEILAAYIFGSVATGRTRPDSDIDIGVL
jgi:predicted nucleotidyltransferase